MHILASTWNTVGVHTRCSVLSRKGCATGLRAFACSFPVLLHAAGAPGVALGDYCHAALL